MKVDPRKIPRLWFLFSAALVTVACKSTEQTSKTTPTVAPTTTAKKARSPIPTPADGVHFYRAIGGPVWARVGAGKVSEQPKGHHWRLTYSEGALAKAEQMRTTTNVAATHLYSYGADKKIKQVVQKNAHDVLVRTTTINWKKRTMKIVLRSLVLDMLGCAALRFKGSVQLGVSSTECLNGDNQRAVNNHGVVFVQTHYDAQGKKIKTRYADMQEKPQPQTEGVEQISYRYNDKDQLIEANWLGGISGGCSSKTFKYNGLGQTVSTTCLNEQRLPIKDHSGVITYLNTYDSNGCVAETRYVDDVGKRMFAANEAYIEKYKRTPLCRALSWTSLDVTDGHLSVKWKHKRFEVRYQYDAQGQLVRESEFNKEGKAIHGSGCGYHAKTYVYDTFGRVIETHMYNKKNKLMNCVNNARNWATVKNQYDGAGLRTQTKFFNRFGKLRRAAWHTQDYQRNKHGYRTKLINHGKPYYESVYVRNENNRIMEVKYMNKEGKPINVAVDVVAVSDPRGSYHRVVLKYDDRGRHTHDEYYKAGGVRITSIPCANLACWSAY